MASKTKIIVRIDPETNHKTRVLLPIDTPDEYADEGIPVSIDLSGLYPDAPETFLARLHNALWQHGLVMAEDFNNPAALTLIRQAVQMVNRYDANDIYQYVRSNQHGRD